MAYDYPRFCCNTKANRTPAQEPSFLLHSPHDEQPPDHLILSMMMNQEDISSDSSYRFNDFSSQEAQKKAEATN